MTIPDLQSTATSSSSFCKENGSPSFHNPSIRTSAMLSNILRSNSEWNCSRRCWCWLPAGGLWVHKKTVDRGAGVHLPVVHGKRVSWKKWMARSSVGWVSRAYSEEGIQTPIVCPCGSTRLRVLTIISSIIFELIKGEMEYVRDLEIMETVGMHLFHLKVTGIHQVFSCSSNRCGPQTSACRIILSDGKTSSLMISSITT